MSALHFGERASIFFLEHARVVSALPRPKKQLRMASLRQTAFSRGVIASAACTVEIPNKMNAVVKIFFTLFVSMLHCAGPAAS
jgi:hypothetical protein